MLRRRGDHARRLSEHERRELQRRAAAGETFASAAAAVGCSTKSIQRLLARTGGLERRAQEQSPLRLSPADREELSRGLVAGESLRQIAGRLGRVASTLSREVQRNGGRTVYRARHAKRSAVRRARRPKPAKLALHSRLRRKVERRLLGWPGVDQPDSRAEPAGCRHVPAAQPRRRKAPRNAALIAFFDPAAVLYRGRRGA
jgi:transposase, IS30 family